MPPQNPKPIDEDILERAAKLLKDSRYTVALTGAGISTPSGIPDFRSADSGVWNNVDPMKVASMQGFNRDPAAFFEWIRPSAKLVREAEPNPAHIALARLEEMGILKTIVTQNFDMLHSRAGSKSVHEIHGHLRESTCIACKKVTPTESFIETFLADGKIPRCPDCGGILKFNVILFNEAMPIEILRASEAAARKCDVMLIVGSSLQVSPVSDLPLLALSHGAKLIIINYEQTPFDRETDLVLHQDVALVLPRLVEFLEGTHDTS